MKASAAPKTLFLDYHRQHGPEITVAPDFQYFQPTCAPSDGRVISNVVVHVLKGESITLYGTGSQT